MKGLLIYQAEDLQKNKWFAQTLCAETAKYGLELLTVTTGQLLPSFQPDFVINRSRDAAISQSYEANGVRCFNNAAITAITNDKWRTHQYLQQHGIPVAETLLHTAESPAPARYPVICKPLDGHGGEGVRLIRSHEQYCAAKNTLPAQFLVQQPMVFGWDMRVYMLGGKPYAAMLRTSDNDFRSNFSLGGDAQPYALDTPLLRLVEQTAALFSPDFVGIDLLQHPDGGYVIGEIEDAVGCRMLYQHTKLNPVSDFAAYVAKEMGTATGFDANIIT